MKILKILLAWCLCTSGTALAQESEFGETGNGLIYADTTINQLKYIVDSLHLKFRVCNDNPGYRAFGQAGGNYFRVEGADATKAMQDIETGLGYGALLGKYPQAEHMEELWIVKSKDVDYNKEPVMHFFSMDLADGQTYRVIVKSVLDNYIHVKNKWIYNFSPRSKYSAATLEAFYMTEDFTDAAIAAPYARMIQYADCMIDTNYTIFRNEGADYLPPWFGNKKKPEAIILTEYAEKAMNLPPDEYDYKKGNDEDFRRYYNSRKLLRLQRLDSVAADPYFQVLLKKTADSIIAGKGAYTDDVFEEMVARYYKPAYALEMKRRRRVIGGCSMDQSPRYHALAIAKLSAETRAWEVFLRAHLDIMNDRFERATDGSYAWQQRQTYIRELEMLDINVPDLLLGITLRCGNTGPNHYYGSIGRLGRAMAETQQPELFETRMLQMIGDQRLDLYNRMVVYFLFLNYNAHLEDAGRKRDNREKLTAILPTFPKNLQKNAFMGSQAD